MKTLVFLSLLSLAVCQAPTSRIRQIVDNIFSRLDHHPLDNVVTLKEWDGIIKHDDTDGDGCVTVEEYKNMTHIGTDAIATNMFNHFDHDNDDCMKIGDMNSEFDLMDTDKDGSATLQEFENHMIGVVSKAVSDATHHGGLVG